MPENQKGRENQGGGCGNSGGNSERGLASADKKQEKEYHVKVAKPQKVVVAKVKSEAVVIKEAVNLVGAIVHKRAWVFSRRLFMV